MFYSDVQNTHKICVHMWKRRKFLVLMILVRRFELMLIFVNNFNNSGTEDAIGQACKIWLKNAHFLVKHYKTLHFLIVFTGTNQIRFYHFRWKPIESCITKDYNTSHGNLFNDVFSVFSKIYFLCICDKSHDWLAYYLNFCYLYYNWIHFHLFSFHCIFSTLLFQFNITVIAHLHTDNTFTTNYDQ